MSTIIATLEIEINVADDGDFCEADAILSQLTAPFEDDDNVASYFVAAMEVRS